MKILRHKLFMRRNRPYYEDLAEAGLSHLERHQKLQRCLVYSVYPSRSLGHHTGIWVRLNVHYE